MLGLLGSWNESWGAGYIKTPDEANERIYCHSGNVLKSCQVNDFVKFDVWQDKRTQKMEAINVTPSQVTFIEVAKDRLGTMEQRYALIRGVDGNDFRCSKDDFDPQSSFRRLDRVCFDIIWQGQFKATNIRPEWSREEWKQWYAEWHAENKALAVDDSACASTDAGTEVSLLQPLD